MYTNVEMIMAARNANKEKYNNIERKTLFDFMMMINNDQIEIASIQRNFCTKKSAGIIASFVIGRGLPQIVLNDTKRKTRLGLPIYEVVDGFQRTTSLLLFISGMKTPSSHGAIEHGMSKFDELICFDGIDINHLVRKIDSFLTRYNVKREKRPYAFITEDTLTKGWTDNPKIWASLEKKSFADFDNTLKIDILEQELTFDINCLTQEEVVALFNDLNKGQTPTVDIETIKAQLPKKCWDMVHSFTKRNGINLPRSNRFSNEKAMLQMFALYMDHNCDDYQLTKTWVTSLEELAVLDEETFTSHFKRFAKEFDSFVDMNLLNLSRQWLRKINNSEGYEVKTKTQPVVLNMLSLFNMFMDDKEIFADTDAAATAYRTFVEKFVAPADANGVPNNTNGAEYLKALSNGVGSIAKFKYINSEMTREVISRFPKNNSLQLAAMTTV